MLYRQYFTRAERAMLDASPLDSALNEINLFRVVLRRLLAASHRKRLLSLESRLDMLAALSTAGFIIASLVRFHWKSTDRGWESNPFLPPPVADDLSDL